MSPAAVQRRLEMVDELRELALDLSRAQRLGPVRSQQDESQQRCQESLFGKLRT
jgi:hypothetical protein